MLKETDKIKILLTVIYNKAFGYVRVKISMNSFIILNEKPGFLVHFFLADQHGVGQQKLGGAGGEWQQVFSCKC